MPLGGRLVLIEHARVLRQHLDVLDLVDLGAGRPSASVSGPPEQGLDLRLPDLGRLRAPVGEHVVAHPHTGRRSVPNRQTISSSLGSP